MRRQENGLPLIRKKRENDEYITLSQTEELETIFRSTVRVIAPAFGTPFPSSVTLTRWTSVHCLVHVVIT